MLQHLGDRAVERREVVRRLLGQRRGRVELARLPEPSAQRLQRRRHRRDLYLQLGVLHLALAVASSEEHTSELQSLMRISYAVFCSNNKTKEADSQISLLASILTT